MIIKEVCPFTEKTCRGDGFTEATMKTGVVRPCMFFSDVSPEHCRIKRAVNAILEREDRELASYREGVHIGKGKRNKNY